MIKLPYGSLYIGLGDKHSDNDTREITEEVFKNKLFKSFHGAHIYDIMNLIDEHEYKDFVLENYPLEKYFQAFATQIDERQMKSQKRKVLFLRAYEVEKQGTFDLPEDTLNKLKELKRKENWDSSDKKYFEKAKEYMAKYNIGREVFFKELLEILEGIA